MCHPRVKSSHPNIQPLEGVQLSAEGERPSNESVIFVFV